MVDSPVLARTGISPGLVGGGRYPHSSATPEFHDRPLPEARHG
jgi:hypothetical protein